MQTKLPASATLVRAPDEHMNVLERDLAAVGIRTIPQNYVRAHKRKALDAHRGELRRIAGFTTPIFRAIEELTLIRLLQSSGLAWLAVAVLGGIIGIVTGIGITPTGFVLAVPMLAVVLLSLAIGLLGMANFERLYSYWRRTPLRSYQGRLPAYCLVLGESAEQMPGVRLYVDALYADPFLVVIRGWGPFKSVAYPAAWDTGDPLLDYFA